MNPIRVGLSMDGGIIYQIAPDDYVKIVILPTDDLNLLLNRINKSNCLELAKYNITKYKIPKHWVCRTFVETADFYRQKVVPRIKKININCLVFNKILYEDDDIILANDIKYQSTSPYYILFYKLDNITSLRELNGSHLELLKKMQRIALELVSSHEKINQNQIRLYVHYYPSIWQLHIHVNLLKDKFESTSIDYGYKLHDIIQNIIICHNYYQIIDLQTIDRFNPISVEYFVQMYLKQFVKIPNENDFIYQEKLRTKDALEYKHDKINVINGKSIFNNIIESYNTENISISFREFIDAQIKSVENLDNYRQIVRRILMYPLSTYPAFYDNTIGAANVLKRSRKFKCTPIIQNIDNKIYCLIDGFNDYIWEKDIDVLLDMNIVKHLQDHDRIHLIHSDVVNKCPSEELENFLIQFRELEYDLEFTGVKHTYSMDWSPISICVVLTIKSKILDRFITQFNEKFAEKAGTSNPSLHRTIGVVYR